MQVRYLNSNNLFTLNYPKTQKEQNFEGKVTLKIPKEFEKDKVFCENTKNAFKRAKKYLQILADKYNVDIKMSISDHKKKSEECSIKCKVIETSRLFGSVIHRNKSFNTIGIFNTRQSFIKTAENVFKKSFTEKSQWD